MKLKHYHFETLDSTNEWAKKNLGSFDKAALTLVSADEQSAARGRYGRSWISPKGINLYATYCFFPISEQCDPLQLTHVMSLSISKLLENKNLKGQIKWPNDILIEKKKIAGILCETVPQVKSMGVILGVGFNVNMELAALEKITQPATSLFNELKKKEDVTAILGQLTDYFQHDLKLYFEKGFEPFYSRLNPE